MTYPSTIPTTTLFSRDGQSVNVNTDDVDRWLMDGWSVEPPKADGEAKKARGKRPADGEATAAA